MSKTKQLFYDLENFFSRLTPKAWFAGDDYNGQPAVVVTQDEIVLRGSKSSVVRVTPDHGIQLAGTISLTATPEQIAVGAGYWRFNPLLLSCLPSTTPTPISVLVKGTPALMEGKASSDKAEATLLSFSDAR